MKNLLQTIKKNLNIVIPTAVLLATFIVIWIFTNFAGAIITLLAFVLSEVFYRFLIKSFVDPAVVQYDRQYAQTVSYYDGKLKMATPLVLNRGSLKNSVDIAAKFSVLFKSYVSTEDKRNAIVSGVSVIHALFTLLFLVFIIASYLSSHIAIDRALVAVAVFLGVQQLYCLRIRTGKLM